MENEIYQQLVSYSAYLYNRNLKIFQQNTLTPIDFANSAVLTFSDFESAKKTILNEIIFERRRLIGLLQIRHNHTYNVTFKKCRKCKTHKVIGEFAPRIDYRSGFNYYNSYCHDCENKRRRDQYAKSDKIKESNRLRQKRWYDNHKKTIPLKIAV